MSIITNKTENGGGDLSWLGSAHGVNAARSVSLKASAFTKATHYPKGYLPSGFPVSLDGNGLAVPYDGTKIAGHIVYDVALADTDVTVPAPLLDHGRVFVAKVPFTGFTKPAAQASTTIVYL